MTSDVDEIIGVIRDLDADIIGLQELGIGHGEALGEGLRDIYPYQALYAGEDDFGLGLLSRYPIDDSALVLTYENYRGDEHAGLMWATVDIEGESIRVFVAHPPVPSPFTFRDRVPRVYDESIRDGQLESLRGQIEDETTPVLVLCDCNMTDQSKGYQTLDGVLDDAFEKAGQGLGFTVAPEPMGLPSILPLIMRVDFVWISGDFVATEVVVGKNGGSSDHRAVVARLVLK
jgi:endonuclease/exonuclease/phosphatase family metal-dependent hydrolase